MSKIFIVFCFVSSCWCYQWVDLNTKLRTLPFDGVVGGFERGQAKYVMRAKHRDGLYPGFYNPTTGKGFLTINGRIIEKDRNIQILTGNNEIFWSKNLKDKMPSIRAGYSVKGESLFICRAWVGFIRIPGKLQNKKCFVIHNGVEKEVQDFETLKIFRI